MIEKDCIYVHFVNYEIFLPTISFFLLRDVPSQDAEGMFNAIKKVFTLTELEFILHKIVFLASDGASVNSGIKRNQTFYSGKINCGYDLFGSKQHLELSLKEWMDPVKLYLQTLCYLYEKSNKNNKRT